MALPEIVLGGVKGVIQLGPRNWGVRPKTVGTIYHTTEYSDCTQAVALQCAADQARRTSTGGWVQPGSYNIIIHKPTADGHRFVLTVPYLDASGGLNPGTSYWAPDRFPWIRDLYGSAYSDPTMNSIQMAFSGKAAVLASGGYGNDPIVTAAKLLRWVETEPWGADDQAVTGHLHWQTNRSDPGAGVIDKILGEYAKLVPPPVAIVTPPTDWKLLYEQELAKTLDLVEKVRRARAALAAKDVQFDATGVAVRDLEKVLAEKIASVRVPLLRGRQVAE